MNMDDGGTSVGTPLSGSSGGGSINTGGGQQTIGGALTTAAAQTVSSAAAAAVRTDNDLAPTVQQAIIVNTLNFRRASLGHHYRRLIFD